MICAPCSSAANATEARVVIDGQHRPFGNQRVHSAQHTGLLVGFADAFGSRTGGFRSDVDGTGFHHRLAMGFGRLREQSQRPPSEKESSVMLSTPIANVRWLS